MFEDGLDFDEIEGKTIEYAISYNDVDCDATLNNFHFDPNDQTIDPIAFDSEIFICVLQTYGSSTQKNMRRRKPFASTQK